MHTGYSPLQAAEAFFAMYAVAQTHADTVKAEAAAKRSAGVGGPAVASTETVALGAGGGDGDPEQRSGELTGLPRPPQRRGGRKKRGGGGPSSSSAGASPSLPPFDKGALAYTRTYGIPGWGHKSAPGVVGGVCVAARGLASDAVMEVADGVGFHAALSGAGALRRSNIIIHYFGVDCVLRVRGQMMADFALDISRGSGSVYAVFTSW